MGLNSAITISVILHIVAYYTFWISLEELECCSLENLEE